MINKTFCRMTIISIIVALLLASTVSCKNEIEANTIEQKFVGYIIDAHCFVKSLVPSNESKKCLQTPDCADEGYGIAVLVSGTTYEFYFFDGKFAPDATSGQLLAEKLINTITREDHIIISVTGTLTGKTIKTPDRNVFPVIKVTSISEQDY